MDALSQSETVSTIGQHEARWNPHFIRWTSIPSAVESVPYNLNPWMYRLSSPASRRNLDVSHHEIASTIADSPLSFTWRLTHAEPKIPESD